jgi:hypothetical protein
LSSPEPLAGGGAALGNISRWEAMRIQHVANRYQCTVHLVGSRAAGKATELSDYDYVVSATRRVRHSVKFFLPRGPRMGSNPGIDIISGPLDAERPHITFRADSSLSAELRGER